MATESNIFEQYCCKAILELTDKGIIRGDYDWDRFVSLIGIDGKGAGHVCVIGKVQV